MNALSTKIGTVIEAVRRPGGRRTTARTLTRAPCGGARPSGKSSSTRSSSGLPSNRRARPGSRCPNSPTRGSPVTSTSARAERSTSTRSGLRSSWSRRTPPHHHPAPAASSAIDAIRAEGGATRAIASAPAAARAANGSMPRRRMLEPARPSISAPANTCAGRTRVMARREIAGRRAWPGRSPGLHRGRRRT